MRERRAPWLLLGALALVGCAGASDGKGDVGPLADAQTASDTSGDSAAADSSDTSLACPIGQAVVEGGACAAVGPPSCATLTMGNAASCVPRWCSRWVDADAKPCALGAVGCGLEAVDCAVAGAVSCAAGEVPQGAAAEGAQNGAMGPCRAVGQLTSDGRRSDAFVDALPVPPRQRWCADDADAPPRDCKPGEVGCAVGEEPVPDKPGLCRPMIGTDLLCPTGFIESGLRPGSPLPRCEPDPGACEQIDPAIVAAKSVIYVDAAASNGDGSLGAPFATLAAALNVATTGAVIAFAAGSYVGTQTLTEKVTLVGRCAALVTMTGSANTPALTIGPLASGTTLRGITFSNGRRGVEISGASKVVVERVLIGPNFERGLSMNYGASATIRDSIIEDVAVVHKGQHAEGIVVDVQSHVTVERVRVCGVAGHGVLVRVDSSLTATDLLVDGTNYLNAEVLGGMGIWLDTNAKATLRRVRLSHNRSFGAGAFALSTLHAERLAIEHLRPAAGQSPVSIGLTSAGAVSKVVASAVRIDDVFGIAVQSSDDGADLKLTHAAIERTASFTVDDSLTTALGVYDAATATVRSVYIEDSKGAGVHVDRKGSKLELEDVVIHHVRNTAAKGGGYGIHLGSGVELTLRRVYIGDVVEAGILSDFDGAKVDVSGLVIDGVADNPDEIGPAKGIFAFRSVFNIVGARIEHCAGVGLALTDPTAAAVLSDVRIAHTLDDAAGTVGVAIVGRASAKFTAAGLVADDSRGVAIVFADQGTTFVGDGVRVDHTGARAIDQGGGHAVYAALGANVTLRGCVLSDNLASGFAADNATLTVDRCVVRRTRFGALVTPERQLGAKLADGLVVVGNSIVSMQRSMLLDNARAGVLLDGPSATNVEATLIVGGIFGIATQNGATLLRKAVATAQQSVAATASDQGLAVPKAPVPGL